MLNKKQPIYITWIPFSMSGHQTSPGTVQPKWKVPKTTFVLSRSLVGPTSVAGNDRYCFCCNMFWCTGSQVCSSHYQPSSSSVLLFSFNLTHTEEEWLGMRKRQSDSHWPSATSSQKTRGNRFLSAGRDFHGETLGVTERTFGFLRVAGKAKSISLWPT